MGSSRRIEKCPQSGWGCMGGGATDHHLEGNIHPVQLYNFSELLLDRSRENSKDEHMHLSDAVLESVMVLSYI